MQTYKCTETKRCSWNIKENEVAKGPNSFIFMQFSGKKLKNNSTFGSWRTPLGKILDPPLSTNKYCSQHVSLSSQSNLLQSINLNDRVYNWPTATDCLPQYVLLGGGGGFEATVQSTECVESLLLNYFFQLMSIPLADPRGTMDVQSPCSVSCSFWGNKIAKIIG